MTGRWTRFAAALLVLVSAPAWAQTGTVPPVAEQQYFDNNGAPLSLGRLYVYVAGTTTAATIYADASLSSGSTALNAAICSCSNLDASGRLKFFLAPSTYRFTLKTSADVLVWDVDNVSSVAPFNVNLDIPGTAGEALTAGDVAYLSNGSGSKTQGRWYKASATNTYSSSDNVAVGLVVSDVSSGNAGSFRVSGRSTGLSGLTVGTNYYASATSGALTSTAPGNVRKVGQADSTTSIVLYANPPPTIATILFVDDFRLSLTTATCETTADVTGASAVTLYLTPCSGNRLTLFDTSGNVEMCTTAEVSIAVPASTSQVYDIFAYDSTFGTCAVTLELLAWTNDTTRATAIAKTSGSNWRYTKSGNTSRMYLGSFRTTTVSGQTEDSVTKRDVWNYYNPKKRRLQRYETTGQWNYTTSTVRQANGSTANQVEVVVGVQEALLDLSLEGVNIINAAAGSNAVAGIGLDSTTTFAVKGWGESAAAGAGTAAIGRVRYEANLTVGRHVLSWNEWSDATGTATWYGALSLGTTTMDVGLSGWIEG